MTVLKYYPGSVVGYRWPDHGADLVANARNPGKEIMWINVGAEAMEFTGPKCHFYHFR